MTPADLLNRLNDRPFKPFRMHMSDGTVLDIPQAGMVIVGETTAVLPGPWGADEEGRRLAKRWKPVALANMTQFSDLDVPKNGKGRRRK